MLLCDYFVKKTIYIKKRCTYFCGTLQGTTTTNMKKLLFLSFILFSCNKSELSPYDKFKMECLEALNFFSVMPTGANYCKGTINQQDFCWSDATQAFQPYASTIAVVHGGGSGNVRYAFGLVDTNFYKGYPHPPEFSFLLGFNMPDHVDIPKAIDETIKVGRLNISQNASERPGDFFVVMPVGCGKESPLGGSDTMWSSAVGDQSDGFVECTKIDKQETADAIIYNVAFRFSLHIYTDNYGEKPWNRLENCAFAGTFSIKK